MMRTVLFSVLLTLIIVSPTSCHAQEVGDVREVELILMDMPRSGEAIATNFMTQDSSDYPYFDHMTWLDKHIPIYHFFQTYRDSCYEHRLLFDVTMIFIPVETYEYKRYEGYIPLGEIVNTWVLTSIVRKDEESD